MYSFLHLVGWYYTTNQDWALIDEQTNQEIYTSRDVINIETQLRYTYSKGSLEDYTAPAVNTPPRKLIVDSVEGSLFTGSFAISVTALINGTEAYYVGYNTALARWNPMKCINCKSMFTGVYDIGSMSDEELQNAEFNVHFHHHGDDLPDGLNYTVSVI